MGKIAFDEERHVKTLPVLIVERTSGWVFPHISVGAPGYDFYFCLDYHSHFSFLSFILDPQAFYDTCKSQRE